ncbi:MAG: DUF4091 domain-containing protein [Candidatus Glassbacteria bacterium]|nr:DUF4091 domain-containing protein [Candidatus Glassbacteria bacterium]
MNKINRRLRQLLFPLLLVSLAGLTRLYGGITGVWAVGDGEKVYRYQADHPSRLKNSVWDGRAVRLKGLYNEVLAFQVIVEADSLGAGAVEIVVEPPAHQASGKRIGAEVPLRYGPSGTIEVFSEHYLQVKHPTQVMTKTNWLAGNEASLPKRMTGWIPDALVPPDARAGRGGQPLDIPRAKTQVIRHHEVEVVPTALRQNQGFWVDLHLPRDRQFPAGTYSGKVRVLSKGREAAVLPLEVELLPHYLPDRNHSNVWLFNSKIESYFPDTPPDELERMLKHTAHRHRIDMVGGFDPHTSRFDPEMMEAYKPYLDGSAFTPARGYQGPGEGEGERLFPVGMYGSDVLGRESRESVERQSDLWVSWFEANVPDVRYFYYIIDEPGETQYSWIEKISGWIHGNPGPGKRLPVFLTRRYTPEIKDCIDIWAGWIDLEKRKELVKEGKDYWFYNGNRPFWGHTLLEVEAADLRVNAWIKYLYGVDTWFIWESTHWLHNSSGAKGHLHQRVFSNPLTYLNWWWDYGNSDGLLLYPGRMPFYPDEDRGLDRLLPSIRLKNVRRGQQDYELMWLAEQKVGREKVLEVVKSVVPKAFSDVGKDEPVPWSERGEDYDVAREKLLNLLGD